jgi:two-component system response regulator AtoC
VSNKENKNIVQARKHLLIIDDEENMCHMLGTLLEKNGYNVDTASDGRSGMEKLESTLGKENEYDFILCDLKMPKMNGMDFLKSVRDKINKTTVIMMSAYGTIDNAIEAMKLGAYDYISKPFKIDEVLLALKKAEERESLKRENIFLKEHIQQIEEKYKFGNMIAGSKLMQSVFLLAEKVAGYDTTVLIQGESGTGKELIARGIHVSGPRSKKPFVAVNCGSIPENLLESEFFGYKKGAFTGADRDKTGFFEEADQGTIFLDEIGELTLNLQVKLLRVLQESEIRPVGGTKTKKINARVIAATSKNLEDEIKTGGFREDLFYRLNVLQIHIPPLRDRIKDIPLLSQHFVKKYNEKLGKMVDGISPKVLSLLMQHTWPGNVRELENVIERAVVLSEKRILMLENLPSEFGAKHGTARLDDFFKGFSLKKAQKIMEKRLISRALEATGGNRTQAARLLEISHPSLLSKMKAYCINDY